MMIFATDAIRPAEIIQNGRPVLQICDEESLFAHIVGLIAVDSMDNLADA